MADGILYRNDIRPLRVHDCRETIFFSEVEGRLCQRMELDISWTGWRGVLEVEISAGGASTTRSLYVRGTGPDERVTVRCWAPATWPEGPVEARLEVRWQGRSAEGRVTIGIHRPWTIYLLSDLCADDTWAYADLEEHDADDCATTVAELEAGAENRYNFATTYQVQRFLRRQSPEECRGLEDALRSGRFYVTPIPNQLLPGAFQLAAFPLLLEPYRGVLDRLKEAPPQLTRHAYHMEAPTWTAGLGNLLRCAGFRSFAKSMLNYPEHAPWVDTLRQLPRLTRWQVAPERFMHLLLRCGDYDEGAPLASGLPRSNAFLHGEVIPQHEALGGEYPVSAIPLVGMYADLSPDAPRKAAVKLQAVREYNAQGWDYPRLVNATWPQFFEHVRSELGDPDTPAGEGLRTVGGAIGGCWEAWPLRIQREHARFRRAQRDVVSLRTLCAMTDRNDPDTRDAFGEATEEVVHLGDHAWNGSSPGSRQLNLEVRRGRLRRLEEAVGQLRAALYPQDWRDGRELAVVNTLGWPRPVSLEVPADLHGDSPGLEDPGSGCVYAAHGGRVVVPDVPGFAARRLTVRLGADKTKDHPEPPCNCPVRPASMRPVLSLDGVDVPPDGGWRSDRRGTWQAGPFRVEARLSSAWTGDGTELDLTVRGTPPDGGYALRWRVEMPWPRCSWRAESGGGFVTQAPDTDGGDLLMGIAGACLPVGGGLSALSPDGSGRVDMAFDQSGVCGPGGATIELARRDPGGWVAADYASDARMRGADTRGRLDWYLLTNQPLPHEAIPDQGGAREWRFRCALRARPGGFDDVALYRFAAGLWHPAEVIEPEHAPAEPWLRVEPDDRIIILGAAPLAQGIRVDLYNPGREAVEVIARGPAVKGRRVQRADMLGRAEQDCPAGRVTVGPVSFARLLIA
ncbi:MAG: hypothetical protein R6X33_07110 [Candidatus Brocadiia bacterium]